MSKNITTLSINYLGSYLFIFFNEKSWMETDLSQVGDPDAADLMCDTVVSQDIDPSFDEPILPEKVIEQYEGK